MHLDLEFPAIGDSAIAADHGYHLYAGLSRELQMLHDATDIAIHPIRGRQVGDRMLQLMAWSTAAIRLPQDRIGEVIALSGKSIDVAGKTIRLGAPTVKALEPATALRSRLVTIKGFMEPDTFIEAVRRQLEVLNVSGQVIATVAERQKTPSESPQPVRRTLRIKDKEVLGFELILEGLSAQESLAVQEAGIGGRRKLGCGVFMPHSPPHENSATAKESLEPADAP